jgi:peptide/nickel transport system substrate-binding protein
MKKIRENIWFIKGFLNKYSKQIFSSIFITLSIYLIGSFVITRIPKSNRAIKVGIVGQFSAGQLPSFILDYLNAGLISINEELEPVPNIAERWDIQDNGNTYIFYLRPNLKWSDGTEVLASDIKFSIPNITVEAQDPNILKFKIPTKFSPFLSLLNIPLLNKSGQIISDYDISLKQKSSGVITQITLVSPSRKIIFEVYSTARQAITAYKLGQLDLVLGLPSEYSAEISSYASVKKYTNFNQEVMLIFNQTDPNLKEKNIRQGIAYAIKDTTFGQTQALTTINPNSWAFSPLIKTYPYNPSRIRELITSPVVLELATNPELLPIAENIKTQLDSDMIQINTKVVTSNPDQFQLLLTTYNVPTDPDQYRDWHSTQATNIGRGADEKLDKLLEDSRVNLDQKERKRIYIDFQKTFSEELPALVLYHPSIIDIARNEADFDIISSVR